MHCGAGHVERSSGRGQGLISIFAFKCEKRHHQPTSPPRMATATSSTRKTIRPHRKSRAGCSLCKRRKVKVSQSLSSFPFLLLPSAIHLKEPLSYPVFVMLWLSASLLLVACVVVRLAWSLTDNFHQCNEEKPCSNCVSFGLPCDLVSDGGRVEHGPVSVQRRGRGRPRKVWTGE
jgi:hypothetical protein